MSVICIVLVLVNAGGVNIYTNRQSTGVVKSRSESKYLVDFTIDFKADGTVLSPPVQLVDRAECVTVGK